MSDRLRQAFSVWVRCFLWVINEISLTLVLVRLTAVGVVKSLGRLGYGRMTRVSGRLRARMLQTFGALS